ncbi:MAG: prepilin peptidase [Planctomycetota bacterium]
MLTAFGYPMIVCLVYLFIIGTVVGSFLNVCIYRIPTRDRLLDSLHAIVSPKSRCPKCGNGIPTRFNVPVLGWLLLRGRCYHCRGSISIRYPLLEFTNGLLWVIAYWMHIPDGLQATLSDSMVHGLYGPVGAAASWLPAACLTPRAILHWQFIYHMVLIEALFVASFIDIDLRIIPDGSTVPAMIVGVLGAAFVPVLYLTPVFHQEPRIARELSFLLPDSVDWLILKTAVPGWIESLPHLHGLTVSLAGLIIGGGTVWLVRAIGFWALNREAMGFGDVILMGLIGSFLGWQATLIIFFLAPLFALTVVAATWLFRRQRELPFGPYLSLAALVVVLFWRPMWRQFEPIFGSGPMLLVAGLSMAIAFAIVMRGFRFFMELFGLASYEDLPTGEWTSADHLFHFSGETVDPNQGRWPEQSWPGRHSSRGWTQYQTWRHSPDR